MSPTDTDVRAALRAIQSAARERTTAWPVEPVYVCRYCRIGLTQYVHEHEMHTPTCPLTVLAHALTNHD